MFTAVYFINLTKTNIRTYMVSRKSGGAKLPTHSYIRSFLINVTP